MSCFTGRTINHTICDPILQRQRSICHRASRNRNHVNVVQDAINLYLRAALGFTSESNCGLVDFLGRNQCVGVASSAAIAAGQIPSTGFAAGMYYIIAVITAIIEPIRGIFPAIIAVTSSRFSTIY